MALHTPAHQLGSVHQAHTLRIALLAVLAAVVLVAVVALAMALQPGSTSTSSVTDKLLTPQLIEFRADERSVTVP